MRQLIYSIAKYSVNNRSMLFHLCFIYCVSFLVLDLYIFKLDNIAGINLVFSQDRSSARKQKPGPSRHLSW